MQKGRSKLNQAGMTLIELVVVILITGILSAGAVVGINYANRMNSTSAGEKLVSLLERTRVYTLSASGTVKLVLTADNGSYYGVLMNGSTQVDKVELGNESLTIKATKIGVNAEGAEVPETTNIKVDGDFEITYNKANGAFGEKYKQIEISGSDTRYVQMVYTTGRSYLK